MLRDAEPLVELIDDVFDHRTQLVNDLRLAVALECAASGLADDDLEDTRERDRVRKHVMPRYCIPH
jgi:hypothetical protein